MGDQRTKGAIIGARGLLFLGAGASRSLGKLLMGEFIEDCKKAGPPWPGTDLFDAITAEKKDLEFLLEQLEALGSMKYLNRVSVDSVRSPTAFLGLGTSPPSRAALEPPPLALLDAARSLLGWTKRRVFEHYGRLVLPLRVQRCLANLLKVASAGEARTVVFTTNYDPAVEEVCRLEKRPLVDGFLNDTWGREYYWDRSAFDGLESPQAGTVVLFKLHGSTTWVGQGGRIVKVRPTFADENALVENILIYPATRKVAIVEPFFSAYDYFEKCLSSATFCVFVGYSFRDYDTVMRLRAAQTWNPGLKVVILDPLAPTLAEWLEDSSGVRATPLPFSFCDQENLYLPGLEEVLGQ